MTCIATTWSIQTDGGTDGQTAQGTTTLWALRAESKTYPFPAFSHLKIRSCENAEIMVKKVFTFKWIKRNREK